MISASAVIQLALAKRIPAEAVEQGIEALEAVFLSHGFHGAHTYRLDDFHRVDTSFFIEDFGEPVLHNARLVALVNDLQDLSFVQGNISPRNETRITIGDEIIVTLRNSQDREHPRALADGYYVRNGEALYTSHKVFS